MNATSIQRIGRFMAVVCLVMIASCCAFALPAAAETMSAPSFSLKNAKTGVVLTWDAVSGAKGYRVYRKTGGGEWQALCNTSGLSYTDDTVVSGESYCYTVRGLDENHTLSPAVSKGVRYIGAPVLRHADAGDNGVTVKWSAVKGASYYRVFYKVTGGWMKLGDTASTAFTDTTISVGQSRVYTVRCLSADKKVYTGDFYGQGIAAKRLATPLPAVANKADGITVSWDTVAGAEHYRVYRREANGAWVTLGDTTACTYADKTPASGVTYAYAVRCVSRDGAQWQSGIQSKAIRFIAAPVIRYANTESNGIEVAWKPVVGAAAYRLFYKTADGWQKIADTTATTYVDTGVKEGSGRTYTVRCITKDGKSYTGSFYGGTAGWRLSSPCVSFYATQNGVKLTWSGIAHAGAYRVYRYQNGGWTRWGDTTDNSFTSKAASGERITAAVRCLSADKKSLYSSFTPVMGQYTTYSYRQASRTMAGCGSFSKTGGITFAQQQSIERYLNAYYTAVGSFTNDATGVFCVQKTADREKTIWNTVSTIRKKAFEDLSLTRYRFSASVSKVEKVSDTCVKVTAWINCNQQFRDIPVLSQVYKDENFFTLKKSSAGNWFVSEHDADCSPFYHFEYDETTKTDKQLSAALSALNARQSTWNAATAKPSATVACDHPYNRSAALAYLLQWIDKRNPAWGTYDPYGGNCMNFASQVLIAGGLRQNDKWQWKSQWNCSDSWVCVGDFADYAESATRKQLCCNTHANYYSGDVGDLVMIGITAPRNHATVISGLVKNEKGQTVDYLLSCNTSDLKNFPASAYHYTNQHLIRIYGYDN